MRRLVRCTGLLVLLLAPFASGDGAECDADQNLALLQQVLSVASLRDDQGDEQAAVASREEAELPWPQSIHQQGQEPSSVRENIAQLPLEHDAVLQDVQPSSMNYEPAFEHELRSWQKSSEAFRSHYRTKSEQVEVPQPINRRQEQAVPGSHYSRQDERAQPINRRQEQVQVPLLHYSSHNDRVQPENLRQDRVDVARPHYSRLDDRVELPWSRFDLQNSVSGQEASELPTSRERAERVELPTDSRLDQQDSVQRRQEQAHLPEKLSDSLPSSLVDEPEDPWMREFIQRDLQRLQQLDLGSAPLTDLEDQRLLVNQLRNDELQKLRVKQLLGEDDQRLSMLTDKLRNSSSSSSKDVKEIDLRMRQKGGSSSEFKIGDKTYRILYPAVSYETHLAHMMGSMAVSTLAAFVFSRYLKEWPEVQRDANPNLLTDWSSGMFACHEDLRSCLCACFCLPVAWADSTDIVRYLPFWNAFVIAAVLRAAMAWPQVAFLCWCLMTCIFTVFRQFLRRIFGMPGAGDCPGMTWDFLTMCCCTCCLVAQEARHIHTASKLGHAGIDRPVVGQAVQAMADQQALQPESVFGPQRR